jgi:hypothetical protein
MSLITTALPFLTKCSTRLNEKTVDETASRIDAFNQSVDHLLGMYKWEFARKSGTLVHAVAGASFLLSTSFVDYDEQWGVYEVYVNGEQLFPIAQGEMANRPNFQLDANNEHITFNHTINPTDVVTIWYYASHTDVTTKTALLNIPLPKSSVAAITLYMKYLVHDGKRQRNDARNAILDFQEVVEELSLQNASKKAKGLSKSVPSPLAGLSRRYANH